MPIPLIVLVVAVLVVVLLFLRPRVASSGTYSEVVSRLIALKQDANPDAFLGFCTRDEDALYFVLVEGVFALDYELNSSKKKNHEAGFRQAASELDCAVIDATYGEFPVLRVKIDSSEKRASEVGFVFAQKMFGHDEKTIFEFLP